MNIQFQGEVWDMLHEYSLFSRWIVGCVVLTIPSWMVWCLVAALGEYKMRDAAVAIGLLYNATVMLLCGPMRKLYLLNKYQAYVEEEERKSQIYSSQKGRHCDMEACFKPCNIIM